MESSIDADYVVSVVRKPIRNIILHVNPDGRIWVSAPLSVSDSFIRSFVQSRKEWIDQRLEHYQHVEPQEVWGEREKLAKFKALRAYLLDVLPIWAQRMGVQYAGFRIKGMKTRWGVCQVKTRVLTFNLYLMRFPEPCIEYVVIHELAHLIEANHSPRFWAIVGQYCPDWKVRRAQMRK